MGLPLDQLAAMAAQPRQQSQQSSRSQKSSSTALVDSQGSQDHGPRIVQLPKGVLYVGAVDTRGRPHGEGELLLRDGSVHAGHFAEGAAHGEGAPAEAAAACALRVHTHACALQSMSAAEDMRGVQEASPYTSRPLTPGVYFDRDGSVHCGGWVTNFRVGDFGE